MQEYEVDKASMLFWMCHSWQEMATLGTLLCMLKLGCCRCKYQVQRFHKQSLGRVPASVEHIAAPILSRSCVAGRAGTLQISIGSASTFGCQIRLRLEPNSSLAAMAPHRHMSTDFQGDPPSCR